MKHVILFLSFQFLFFNISAQQCDIASQGVVSSTSSVMPGETVDISFDIYNGGEPGCSYNIGEITAVLSLPPYLEFTQIVSPSGGDGNYFAWSYDNAEHVMFGENDAPIGFDQGEFVTFRFTVLSSPDYPVLGVNIALDISSTGSSNFPGNDDHGVPIDFEPALPIKLTSFSARSNECGKVDLAWSTASEVNNDYMEVQRSTDGKSYIAVGVVKGANNPRGADYTYTDDHALIDGVRYYYRLKQVDFDGRSETHKVVSVMLKCPSSELGMKIYPNPAIYNTSLTITGANNPGVSQVKMTNASGEVVRTFSVETDVVKEIDLTGLPAGIYQLQSSDLAAPLVKRFIKID